MACGMITSNPTAKQQVKISDTPAPSPDKSGLTPDQPTPAQISIQPTQTNQAKSSLVVEDHPQIPEVVSNTKANDFTLVEDGHNTIHLLWRTDGDEIIHRQHPSGGNWSQETHLVKLIYYVSEIFQVLLDPDGNLCVVWAEESSQRASYQLKFECQKNETWQSPGVVNTPSSLLNGMVTMVWYHAVFDQNQQLQFIYFLLGKGLFFGNNKLSDDTGMLPGTNWFFIDPDGSYQVFYRVNNTLKYTSSNDQGNNWSAPEVITTDFKYADIIPDQQGQFWMIGWYSPDLYYQTWSAKQGLGTPQTVLSSDIFEQKYAERRSQNYIIIEMYRIEMAAFDKDHTLWVLYESDGGIAILHIKSQDHWELSYVVNLEGNWAPHSIFLAGNDGTFHFAYDGTENELMYAEMKPGP